MSEEKKQEEKKDNSNTPLTSDTKPSFRPKKDFSGRRRKFADKPKEEFDQRILDVARVTRVMKGGKRMSFRVCVVIGDKKGRVAVATGKGADVTLAVNKAVNKAKKNIIRVPIYNNTIPHQIFEKFGSSKIIFKPAAEGRGVIAGGVVRVILELAGVKNVSSKILGTNNKLNNSKCTVIALSKLRRKEDNAVERKGNEKKIENKK